MDFNNERTSRLSSQEHFNSAFLLSLYTHMHVSIYADTHIRLVIFRSSEMKSVVFSIFILCYIIFGKSQKESNDL